MSESGFAAGLWMFGQFIDRYATDAYGPAVGTLEAIGLAAQVDGIRALDINYPFSEPDLTVEQVAEVIAEHGLRVQAVTPVIYNRTFRHGAFTHPDADVRQAAVDICHRAVEVAGRLGADYVKLWPGQDGFDYPFQVSYMTIWNNAIGCVREVASAARQTRFAIEYKSKEPRTHILFSTAARTLLAIEEMEVDNVGLVVDLGHSIYARETPADVLQLVASRGRLTDVELNDNFREWDDDLSVGSVHLLETLEFLDAVRAVGWKGPLKLDQFPFREDPVEAARASIRMIRRLEEVLDRIDSAKLRDARDRQDALAAQDVVFSSLIGPRAIQS